MQKIRRLVAVASVTALAAAFAAGPASADNAEVYMGNAAARALNISVKLPDTGQQTPTLVQATLGTSTAKAASDLTASATGIGEVVPGVIDTTTATASANAAKLADDPAAACGKSLSPLGGVTLGLACGDASAFVSGNLPSASSEGSVASLSADATNVLSNLDAVTATIGPVLSDALKTVCSTLDATCPATTTVNDLVTSVLTTKTLDATIGKSTSSVTTTASTVTSKATAAGAVINILPLPQVNGLPSTKPVATIEIGSASASATYDRATGAIATPTFDPAIVRIKLNTALNDAVNGALGPLGVSANEIVIQGDQASGPILDNSVLRSEIIVGKGKVVDGPNGSKGAIADGVTLHLLEGIGASSPTAYDGGITLELAHAEAFVGGTPASVTPAACTANCTPADVARELPRTGGNPFLPLAGVVVLTAAVLLRRATVRVSAKGSDL
jgi:enamine deaminase RidA (YjgF/YER057c/UK114 family)